MKGDRGLWSGRRSEVADEDLRLCFTGGVGDRQNLRGGILGDVGLSAVFADLGRDLVDHDGLPIAMEGDRRGPGPGLSLVAHDAVHRVFRRVLKSGSYRAGSGWYAVSTIVSSSEMLSRTATCSAASLRIPKTSRAGYGSSPGRDSMSLRDQRESRDGLQLVR